MVKTWTTYSAVHFISTLYFCYDFDAYYIKIVATTTPRAYGILVCLLTFFFKFMLFEFRVKDDAETIDHMQIVKASRGPVEAYTCESKLTPSHIIEVCSLNFEKFDLV